MTENIFELLMRPRGRQKYAPSGYPGTPPTQTAFMQYGAGAGGGGGRGGGGGIEPPIIARKNPFGFGIRGDDVDQAFNSMYNPMESNWLNRMFFSMGPQSPNNWIPNIFQGLGMTTPITGDVNVQGGSRHMGQRKNK
jgi:hypothetical protein